MAAGSSPTAPTWRAVLTVALLLGLVATLSGLRTPDRVATAADVCLGSTSPSALSSMFRDEPGGVVAADYQRAVPLPDGRTLWLFQDATIRLPPPPEPPVPTEPPGPSDPPEPPPPTERLLHNVGMIQSGSCFTVLHSASDADPEAWLLPGDTTPYAHWFWPLGAEMGADGKLYVYVAEMFERGGLYLSATEPTGTRIVGLDVATLQVAFVGYPPDSSAQLYGFSTTSDRSWTYLYGQCHRQFGWDIGPFGVPAHDVGCAGNVPVARVPKGRLFDPPQYWDGASWQTDPNRAVSVMPDDRTINPSQVRWFDGEFVAVSKVDDWFGSTIYLDRAPRAEGPWTNYARLPSSPRCSPYICNTYFASWVPATATSGQVGDDLVIGVSHNRWDGRVTDVNRPTYLIAPAPGSHAFALRCTVVDC